MTSPTGRNDVRRDGFTLIELALVTVIIATLLTVAIPRLQHTVHRMRADEAAVSLAQLLRTAHEHAIMSGQTMSWTWEDAAGRAHVQPAAKVGIPEGPDALRSAVFPGALSVSVEEEDGSPVPCACVKFYADGTSEAMMITVRLHQHVLTLAVDETTGQTSLTAGAAPR